MNITVTPPPNDPPACSDVSRNIAPGAPATIQLACSDPDGDPVTLEIVTAPAHGTLGAIDQGTDRVVYTPDAGYTGGDSFSYRATDGTVAGPEATVSIDVTGAPECEDVTRKTEVGAAVAIPLSCTDPDGDALTLSTIAAPSHGTLGTIDQGTDQVLYTPNAGFHGSDSFTYRASDGTAASAAATVSITVTRAPSCDDVARRTAVGTAVSVPLSCADADGDTLTLSITGAPAHGSLGAIAGGAVTYTPQAGYFGTDTFTFKASDGTASSAAATASITVTRAPSCSDVARTTAAGVAVTVPLTCTDPDGDALTLSKLTDPSKGTLGAFSSSSVTYTPTAGKHGADSFTYRASDGTAASAAATVSITITRAPTCSPVSAKTAVGTAVPVALDCTDARRRPALAGDRERPVEGLAGRDLRRLGDVHAVGRPVRHRHVHVPRKRRHGAVRHGHRDDHGHAAAELPDGEREDEGRHRRRGAAELLRPGRRRADALDRRRALEGHARPGVGRHGPLHARRGPVRRRLLHLPRVRRHRHLGGGHGQRHDHARAGLPGRRRVGHGRLERLGAADLLRRRRRLAHAGDRGRTRPGLARRDLGRLGDLHAATRGAFGEDSFTYTADDGAGRLRARRRSRSPSRGRRPASPVETDTPAGTPVDGHIVLHRPRR